MSTKGKSKGDDKTPAFDESLGRLEEIVSELEGGGLGLEESLARYKEGVVLLEGCRGTLASFRAQVEELRPDGGVSRCIGQPPGENAFLRRQQWHCAPLMGEK